MAITATFGADFSDFVRGVNQAEAKLADLQTGAAKVPAAMQQITSSSTGSSAGWCRQGFPDDKH